MEFNKKALLHDKKYFRRGEITSRFNKFEFGNLARLEIFLWNLEIYLQIQNILKGRAVLKGGAAVQFYLPINHQRTSVDIDLICLAKKEGIERSLQEIEKKFNGQGGLFKFRPHKPKEAKTELPLLTYYVLVPSVCTEKELFGKHPGTQEIKVEFFASKKLVGINKASSPSLFAFKTTKTYNILPLNFLIGDKLTTLGPKTIGIPQERSDEIMKQIYDINALLSFNYKELDFFAIKKYFLYRSKLECDFRGIGFDTFFIFSDMLSQLKELCSLDIENNKVLKKMINDFQSLYLKKSARKSNSEWAIVGERLHFFVECLSVEKYKREKLSLTFSIEKKLQFNEFHGAARGENIKRFKEGFIKEFGGDSFCPAKILKGKNPIRVFWAIASPDNLEVINSWIDNFFK